MATQTLNMDNGVPDTSMMLDPIGIDFPWWAGGSPSFNSVASQTFDVGNKSFPNAPQESSDQFRYVCNTAIPIRPSTLTGHPSLVDAMLSFTELQSTTHHQQPSPATMIDPINMWQSKDSTPGITVSKDSTRSSLPSSSIVKMEEDEMRNSTPETSQSPTLSGSSLRARHAANHRHKKFHKARRDSHQSDDTGTAADRNKDRLREKNKVAAAKCRQRQRKQAQSIQKRGGRLSDANAELKAKVQALRGELNQLRAIALYHQGCNCQVANYNCKQAARIAAEYSSNIGSPPYRGQVGGPPA